MKYLAKFNENNQEDLESYLKDVLVYITDETKTRITFDESKQKATIQIFLKNEIGVDFKTLVLNKKINLNILNLLEDSIHRIKDEYPGSKVEILNDTIGSITNSKIMLRVSLVSNDEPFMINKNHISFFKDKLEEIFKEKKYVDFNISSDGAYSYLVMNFFNTNEFRHLEYYWTPTILKEYKEYLNNILKLNGDELVLSLNKRNTHDKTIINVDGTVTKKSVFSIEAKLNKKYTYSII